MRVSKIGIGMGMKVSPQRFEPFDVSTYVEVEMHEGEDVEQAKALAQSHASAHLQRAMRHELDNIYGPGTAERILGRA
jgi:hypothetical protein